MSKIINDSRRLSPLFKELEEALKIKQNLRYEDPYYWLDVDTKKEGPFCQTCYESEGKLICLQRDGEGC